VECASLSVCQRTISLTRCRLCSAQGISLAALFTEVSCYACSVAYGVRQGYVPAIWGSDMACWTQDLMLLAMVAYMRKLDLSKVAMIGAAWLGLQAMVFSSAMPIWLLAKFQVRTCHASNCMGFKTRRVARAHVASVRQC
jgi:hypothetical protein